MLSKALSNKRYLPILIIVGAFLIAALMVITKPKLKMQPTQKQLPSVSVTEVKVSTRKLQVKAQGTVVPRTEANLIPEVNGKIVWTSPTFVAGGFIREGEELLKIDSADYQDATESAESYLTKAEIEEELAKAELTRLKKLQKKKLASQSQLDQADRTARVTKADLRDARIKLKQAKRDLARTTLFAPFTGRIRNEKIDVGQFVSRGENIGSAYATDYVEVRLPIVNKQLAYLDFPVISGDNLTEVQQPLVTVYGEYAGRDLQWQGRLVRTESELDVSSRMVYGVVRVENTIDSEKLPLKVGMFVSVVIEGRQVVDVVDLPRIALRNNNQVMVLDEANILRFRDVNVLRIERDTVIIDKGLVTGDKVCVSPLVFAVDGIEVIPLLN